MTSPHHPAADRLPACDACGAPSEPYTASQPHYTIFAKRGCGDVVHLCRAHKDERPDKTAEQILARRKSLTAPPASASEKFKVGDRVGAIGHGFVSTAENRRVTGILTLYVPSNRTANVMLDAGQIDPRDGHEFEGEWAVHFDSVRPAASAQRIEPVPCAACGAGPSGEAHRLYVHAFEKYGWTGVPLCNACSRHDTETNYGAIKSRGGWPRNTPSANPPEAPIEKTPTADLSQPVLPPAPSGGDSGQPNVWGIAAATVEAPVPKRSDRYDRNRCNEPGCDCPYCWHRAWSPKLGANDPRYPASTLDATIASLESDGKARAAAVRAPWDWPGVDEFEVVPRVRKIGDE